jgi:ferredoxin
MAATAHPSPVQQQLHTLVAVCDDARVRQSVADIGREVARRSVNAVFVQVPGLCADAGRAVEHVERAGASRLILGLCPGEFSVVDIQRTARRAGLDPFGVQTLDFRRWRDLLPDSAAVWGAALSLAAAVARAAAFKGSTPEQSKAVLRGLSEPVSRRALFMVPPVRYVPVPAIDHETCVAAAGCRECVKACPHGALASDAGTVTVDRSACSTCGLCVAVCPQRAVDLPGHSVEEIEAHVDALTGGQADGPVPIAFVCRSASRSLPGGWQPVEVACSGMVSAAAILAALARGAAEVGIYRCTAACANSVGDRTAGIVDYCRRLLKAGGRPEETVRLLTPADAGRAEPPAKAPSPVRAKPADGAMASLFGAGAAGRAIMDVMRDAPGDGAVITHPFSPVGLPTINAEACTGCGTCSSVCPASAITQSDEDWQAVISVEPSRCIGCMECVAACPERERGAISVSLTTDVARIGSVPEVQFRGRGVRCRSCGRAFTTREVLERLKALLGEDYREEPLGTLCTECRGR